METFLRLSGNGYELFFHTADATPQQLRIELSKVYGMVSSKPRAAEGGETLAAQLAQVAQLFEQNLLTATEFDAAKRKLLGHDGSP